MVVRWQVYLVAALLFLVGAMSIGLVDADPSQPASPSCRWNRLAPDDARTLHTLVDYPSRGVVAFGGAETGPGGADLLDDARLLRLVPGEPAGWHPITVTGETPVPRVGHASVMRNNPGGGFQMITFGGSDGLLVAGSVTPAAILSDTHALDLTPVGGHWSEVVASGAQVRAGHSAIYRPSADEIVVFGGRVPGGPDAVVDTVLRLKWDPEARWDELTPEGQRPSPRMGHSAAYDEPGDRMIVFGGTDNSPSPSSDTWALNFAGDMPTWEQLTPTGAPPTGRFDHATAYLPDQQWMLVYGGTSDGFTEHSDLHLLDLSQVPPQWTQLHPGGNQVPPAIQGMAAAFSSTASFPVFYGGEASGSARGEAWALRCDDELSTPTATVPTAGPTGATTEPAPTSTVTPTVTATPTVTPTIGPSDIVVHGHISVAETDPMEPLQGATVTVPPCHSSHQPFVATSGADGGYALTLPGAYFGPGCTVEIVAAAEGYVPVEIEVLYEDLVAVPMRDFALRLLEATPTATATEGTPPTPGPGDIEMTGTVTEAGGAPIDGATIRVPPCITPHQDFRTTTGADGRYLLVLPSAYIVPGCDIDVFVAADGYEPTQITVSYEELKQEPMRDFELVPAPIVNGGTVFLPFAEPG